MVDAHNGHIVEDLKYNSQFRCIASIGNGVPYIWYLDDHGVHSHLSSPLLL